MSASFLHGVETLILDQGPNPVTIVKSAVVGLVGISPTGPINTPTLVQGDRDAAAFGSRVPGFNIPQALAAIFAQGAGSVIVVNVFDPAVHTTQVTLESHVLANGKTKTGYPPIGTINVFDSSDGTSSFVLGTDYTFDAYGNYVALTNAASTGTIKFSYKKLNASVITSSVIIGAVDGTTGLRTGIKAWSLSKNLFGFNPKLLIAPGYSTVTAVVTELDTQAAAFRAIALVDAPYGTTVAGAITARGIAGSLNINTNSKRVYILYPYLKAYDPATDANVDYPYSSFMAGVIAETDLELGFWNSPSNKEIKRVVGAERNISASLSDATSDANTLNAAGITTIFNTFGTGIRTWGNRSASFPVVTTPDNFVAVQRTADVVHDSLELAVLQFIDQPITQALIDAIRETCNGFIRTLIGRGALIPGSRIEFPKDQNQPTDLAAGKLTFDIIMMPPVPGERITFRSFIDINLLKNLS